MTFKFKQIVCVLVLFLGCQKNPIERLTNPLPDGSVPQSSGIFRVFENELLTGGGAGLIPNSGHQTLDLANHNEPRRGRAQIRYAWNGQDVDNAGTLQHAFAGFQLLISQDFSSLASTPARNFSAAGYTTMTLYIRGSLSLNTTLRIEGPDDANTGTTPSQTNITSLSSEWTPVTLAVPSGDFSNVKSFITVTFQYAQPAHTTLPGEGGEVYINGIQYEN